MGTRALSRACSPACPRAGSFVCPTLATRSSASVPSASVIRASADPSPLGRRRSPLGSDPAAVTTASMTRVGRSPPAPPRRTISTRTPPSVAARIGPRMSPGRRTGGKSMQGGDLEPSGGRVRSRAMAISRRIAIGTRPADGRSLRASRPHRTTSTESSAESGTSQRSSASTIADSMAGSAGWYR